MKAILSNTKYLLTGAVILMALVSYRFAFRNTIAAWQLNKQLKEQLSQSEMPAQSSGYLQRKQVNLSKIINNYKVDTATYRTIISDKLAILTEKYEVRLVELPTSRDVFIKNNTYLQQQLTFEGTYSSLVKFLDEIGKYKGIGAQCSIHIYTIPGRKENTGYVNMTMVFCGIKK